VLQLESQLASNVQALIESENNFDLSKQNLNNVLARPIETPFEVMEIGELPDVLLVPEEVTALAVRNRPEVQAAELTIDALENVVESEEGGSLPTFSLGASYQYTIDAPMGVDDTSALGTLSISWPVFDSGITRNRVNAAEEQVNQAEIRLEQLQLGISLDVNNALTQISNASATLEVAQQNLETATEALRLAELRFDAGEGILLDVLDAQAQVTGAQANLVAARTQYLIAFANLQRAVGMDEFNEQPQEEDADEANRE
jgi:outer membrane protein TolC